MVVSQLPRWPAASLSVSWACAVGEEVPSANNASAPQNNLSLLIDLLLPTLSCWSPERARIGIVADREILPGRSNVAAVSLGVARRVKGCGSIGALRVELLVGDAQRGPLNRLRNDALERLKLYMPNMYRRGSNRQTTVAEFFRGLDHDAAELHDSDVAGAEALARAIGNRAHRLPHRGVLVRNTGDPGVAALLHGVTILQVVVCPVADGTKVTVKGDPD